MARFRCLAQVYEWLPKTLVGLDVQAFAMLILKWFITFMVENA